jgi:cytochrome c556
MRKLRAVPVVLLLVALAACGSSSKSSSGDSGGGSSTLSKSDFVSQGNAICKAAGKDAKGKPPTDAAGVGAYLGTLIQQTKDARTKFAALNAPSDSQQLQKDFLASIDKVVAAAGAAKAKADAGDLQGAMAALDAVDTTTLDKQLNDYGLKECATES